MTFIRSVLSWVVSSFFELANLLRDEGKILFIVGFLRFFFYPQIDPVRLMLLKKNVIFFCKINK